MSASVCTVNPPGHDWQNGLVCRWCHDTRTVTEAILSQLSSRRGGTPADAQKLLDAYRAEVLREAASVVGNDDDCDCGGCDTCIPRKLAARLLEMADEGNPVGSAPDNGTVARRAHLAQAIGRGGRWKSGTVTDWYAANGYTDCTVRTARGDLAALWQADVIVMNDEPGVRYYTAARQGGGRRG
ncbi:hypothetical protein ABZ753_21700 [Streptomyces griseoincarnatus]